MGQLFIVRSETHIDSANLVDDTMFELDRVVHQMEVMKDQAMYLYNGRYNYWLLLSKAKHTGKVLSLVVREEYVPKLVRMRQLLER